MPTWPADPTTRAARRRPSLPPRLFFFLFLRPRPSAPPPAAVPLPPRADKLSFKEQRDYDLLPARIEELEGAIAKGETILSDPDLFTADPQKFANISKGLENARAEKDEAEERWLELAERVESA